jgi:dTDP-4-amino-4,6-dideoxygalactose transaminase
MKTITVTKPFMPPLVEFMPYLEKIWQSKQLTNNGPFHQQLEDELAEYLGVKYISLFANATLGLVTALQALDISGEVITTPYSFVATTHALWWNKITPVFVDIEPEFLNLDPARIEAAITPRTSAIMPVHVYGNPCDVDEIQRIADRYGLKVIYDAAHAFGVHRNKESILNFGDLSVVSFHATKTYSTIEGGAVICHTSGMKRHLDNLKNFGFRDEVTVEEPGINAKLNEVQAAYGLLQLKHIDKIIKKRKRISDIYRRQLRNIPGLRLIPETRGVRQAYTYFPILVDEEKYGLSRDGLYDKLKRHNIIARRYFYPLISSFEPYCKLPSARADNLPNAAIVADRVLCLPIYPDLKDEDVQFICSVTTDLI